jgi:hypothetical protein
MLVLVSDQEVELVPEVALSKAEEEMTMNNQ